MHIRVQAAIVAKYCAAHGYNFWRGAGDMAALANCATYSAMLKSSTRIVKCTCEKCKAAYVRRKAYMKTFKKGLAQGVLAAATRRIQGQTVGNKVGGPPFEVKPSPGIVTAAGPVPGITLAERKIAERKLAEAAHKAAAKGAAAKEPAGGAAEGVAGAGATERKLAEAARKVTGVAAEGAAAGEQEKKTKPQGEQQTELAAE